MTVVAFAADFKLIPDVEAIPGGGLYNLYGALAVGPGRKCSKCPSHICQPSFIELHATRLIAHHILRIWQPSFLE